MTRCTTCESRYISQHFWMSSDVLYSERSYIVDVRIVIWGTSFRTLRNRSEPRFCVCHLKLAGIRIETESGKKKGSPVLPSAQKKHFHNKIPNMESIHTERKVHSNFEALIENIPKVASTFALALHDQSVATTIEPQRKALAKKNTDKNTAYGRKRFNDWWSGNVHTNIVFNCEKFPDPSFIRFIQAQDSGIAALLELSHVQRASILSQFVVSVQSKNTDFKLRARTIKGMLDGIQREIWEVEGSSDVLMERFGEWSCTKHKCYKTVRDDLKNLCLQNEVSSTGNFKCGQSADALSFWEFEHVQTLTLFEIAHAKTFRDKLIKIQHYAMQNIGRFIGSRGIQEIHDMKVTDFTYNYIDHYWLEYFPSNYGKTVKVTSEYSIAPRYSGYICGRSICDVFRLLSSHRNPDAEHYLFLKVLNDVMETDKVWFANQRVGSGKIGKAVNTYTEQLLKQKIIDEGKYANTSLRKLVVENLSLKGAPECVVSSAIGHFGMSGASNKGGFRDGNLGNYMSALAKPIMRKKIAVLMSKTDVKWRDVEDDQLFFSEYVVQNSPAGVCLDSRTFAEALQQIYHCEENCSNVTEVGNFEEKNYDSQTIIEF